MASGTYFDIEQNAIIADVEPCPSSSPIPPISRAVSPSLITDRSSPCDHQESDGIISSQAQVEQGPSVHRKVKKSRVRAKLNSFAETTDYTIHRRGRKSAQIPLHLQGGYPYIFEQSRSGGWVNDSDSDCSDVFSEVRKVQIDTVKQIYMILGVVVFVLFSVGSIYLFEWIYGKPKIPDNTFDFMDNDEL